MSEHHPSSPPDLTKTAPEPVGAGGPTGQWYPPQHPGAAPRRSGTLLRTLLAAAVCLAVWTVPVLVSLPPRIEALGAEGLVVGVVPTSFAFGLQTVLPLLLVGPVAAALAVRRFGPAVLGAALALPLGVLGHLLSAVLLSRPQGLDAVLLGLVLTAVVVLPTAVVAGLLGQWSIGRLVLLASSAGAILMLVQGLSFQLTNGRGSSFVYDTLPKLLLGAVVLLVVAVAVGGGRGGPGTVLARLASGLVLMLLSLMVVPAVALVVLDVGAELLPRDLGGGLVRGFDPGAVLDRVVLPVQALRTTWPTWVGGAVLGIGLGLLVRLLRRGSGASADADRPGPRQVSQPGPVHG